MKISNYILKTPITAVLFFACLQNVNAAALDVSQKPLILVDSVAPNLVVTLDDSGSMWRSAVPDSLEGRHDRRGKSAAWNPLYYNPAITYEIPRGLDTSGKVVTFDTSFTQAWHNGFDTTQGSVDLSRNYRVTWYCDHNDFDDCEYDDNSIGDGLARNPSLDFGGVEPEYYAGYYGTCSNDYPLNSGGYTYTCQNGSFRGRSAYFLYRFPIGQEDLTEAPVPAYYYVLEDGCSAGSSDENCYTKVDVSATSGLNDSDERKNFAIWYSFYRDRGLATKSAAHLAFYTLPNDMRLTWQALNRCTAVNSTQSACVNNKFRRVSDEHKGNFYTWLKGITFGNGTPLRGALSNAGEFLKTNDAWAFNPNPFSGSTVRQPEYACRSSFHIMMTDGIWNGNSSIDAPARADDEAFDLPDGTAYNGTRAPYADDTTKTLADYAMDYWATDLRSGLDNEVKAYTPFRSTTEAGTYWDARNNPATWQSMSNFMVALGLGNALNKAGIPWSGSTFEGTGYNNLVSGTDWPAAGSDKDENVYDLWHAAINSRGEFFSADSPDALTKAFKDILNRIAERQSTAAAAGSTTSVSAEDPDDPYNLKIVNRAFFPEFDSADWSGDVKRKDIKRELGGVPTREQVWSAKVKLNAMQPSSRNILIGGGAGLSGLREFSYTNLTEAQKAVFDLNPDSSSGTPDNRGADRVAYLRGSRALEGTSASDFRRRGSLLGDIINSTPVVVGEPAYIPYLADDIDGDDGDYIAFREANKDRPELVYVGANDGMLHAFFAGKVERDDQGNETVVHEGGKEAFSFIPKAVINNLPKLTAQSYKGGAHQFYVDGSPLVRDVYFGGSWRTVLIGTLRAGGKSIFALDITDPGENGSGVKLLWEITDQTAGYANLGYTFPQPEVARLHTGQWAVLLGNGYDSANDAASMFIIDIADGSLIKELVVDNADENINGLSAVRGADNNSDGVVDYAYAGDLRGNLWRFDLAKTVNEAEGAADPFNRVDYQSSVSVTDFKVSYGGQPLYKAVYPAGADDQRLQPITAPPSLIRHPTRRGYLVIFGTGKFFETDDASGDTEKANSIYAIWDRKTRAETTSSAPTLSRTSLVEQTIVSEQVGTFLNGEATAVWDVRTLSENPVQWYQDDTTRAEEVDNANVNKWGWYLDLRVEGQALKGEMMLDRMTVSGDALIFGTLTPNDDPCADGASYWVYALNAEEGGRLDRPALDFNRDGTFDSNDTINDIPPSGYGSESPPSFSPDGTIITVEGQMPFEPSPELQGRQSWQVVPLDVAEGEEEPEEGGTP
ncbi:pilus assembly protein [Halopseudomonas sp.]|uniref:pilus assembly protein n=1 Tax=Halopseudomonas sp. TaxID=2901191 RepID=UPI0030022C79